jgi:hypothetical protein
MIWGHLHALRSRLTDREIRAICAARLGRMGRNAYAHGEFSLGLPLMAKAIGMGDSLFHNIYHLAAAAPPVQRLRSIMQSRLSGATGKSPVAVLSGGKTP